MGHCFIYVLKDVLGSLCAYSPKGYSDIKTPDWARDDYQPPKETPLSEEEKALRDKLKKISAV